VDHCTKVPHGLTLYGVLVHAGERT
jgi:hypothetical protein